MTDKYPFIPSHLEKALEDTSIPLIDLIHGHLKVAILEAEQNMIAAQNNEPLGEDEYDESDDYHHGYINALTDLYTLTYNLSIDRQRIEESHHAKLGL